MLPSNSVLPFQFIPPSRARQWTIPYFRCGVHLSGDTLSSLARRFSSSFGGLPDSSHAVLAVRCTAGVSHNTPAIHSIKVMGIDSNGLNTKTLATVGIRLLPREKLEVAVELEDGVAEDLEQARATLLLTDKRLLRYSATGHSNSVVSVGLSDVDSIEVNRTEANLQWVWVGSVFIAGGALLAALSLILMSSPLSPLASAYGPVVSPDRDRIHADVHRWSHGRGEDQRGPEQLEVQDETKSPGRHGALRGAVL